MDFLKKLESKKIYFSWLGYIGVCYLILIMWTSYRKNIGIVFLIVGSIPFLKNYKLSKSQKLFLFFLLLLPLVNHFNIEEKEIILNELRKLYRFFPILLAPLFLNSVKRIKGIFIIITGIILINCSKIFIFLKSINFKLNGYTYDGVANLGYTSHAMAGLSFISLGLALIYFLEKQKLKALISSVLYLIIIYFVLIGQRRGAYLGILIPLFIILCINMNKKILIYGTLIGLIITGISLQTNYLKNNVYYKRFISIKDIQDSSPAIRIVLWKASLQMFKEKPLIGYSENEIKIGYLNYIENNKKELLEVLPSLEGIKYIANIGNPHSTYMKIIVDIGILGIYLIFLFYYILFENLKIILLLKKELNSEYIISLISFGTISSFMIIGLTENIWNDKILKEGLIIGIIIYFSIEKLIEKIKFNN